MAVSIHGNNGFITTNGTAAAPSLAAPDTDTGLYFGTNLIHATTSGSERLKIKADGKIEIPTTGKLSLGMSSPVAQFTAGTANGSRVIEIQGTDGVIRGFDRNSSAWAQIDFEASQYVFDCGGTERLRLKSDGTLYTVTEGAKFGVSQDPTLTTMGSTSGTWQLPEVDASTIGAEMRIGDINSNSVALIRLASYGSSDDEGGGAIMFTNTRLGSALHHSDLAAIKGARETLGKGYLRFFTANQAANAERMRITSTGVVSINDSTPETWATLQVNNHSTHNACQVLLRGADQAQIILRDDTGGSNTKCTTIRNDQGALIFGQHNDAFSAFTPRLRITSTGDVGINCTPHSNAGINLQIHGDNTTSEIRLTNTTTGSGNNGGTIQMGGNTLYISNSENDKIAFETNGSERLRITGGGNVQIDNDSGKFELGADQDISFYHTGTHGFLENDTGTFYIKGDTISLNKANGGNVLWTNGSEMRIYPQDVGFGGAVPGGAPAGKNVFLAIGDSDTGIVQDGDGQLELWANNNEVANINAIDGYTSTKPITTSGDITASGGAGAITLSPNADIRLQNGTWTGDYGAKIQHHDNYLFLQGGSNGVNLRNAAGSRQLNMSNDGHFGPANGQTYNLGSSSLPWAAAHFAGVIYATGTESRIQVLRNVASTYQSAEFRNQHSVYGGGVQFKSNNTYGTLEIVNYNASGSAAMYNSTGGWHWTGNLQTHSNISPWTDNTHDVGSSSKRWDDVYATNGSIQTSDRNEKNTIVTSDLGLSFINKLKPVSYKFNNKARTHYGLIAQDVETVLSDISKPSSGFAGFIKTEMAEEKYDDAISVPEGKKVGDIMTPAHTAYGLRYNEFIAPLIKAIQELSAKNDALESRIAALEGS